MKRITLVILLMLPISSFADELIWTRAVAIANDNNPWNYQLGKAEISTKNNVFLAKLYDKDHPNFLRYTLNGDITNNKVKAILTIHGSDFSGSEYTGYIDNFKAGIVVQLSDGYSFIGVREKYKQK